MESREEQRKEHVQNTYRQSRIRPAIERRVKQEFSSHIFLRSLYGSALKGDQQFAHLLLPISRPSAGTTFPRELKHKLVTLSL